MTGPTLLGIEGGGTSWRVAIAKGRPDNIIERAQFDTTTPEETFAKIKAWIKDKKYDAVGVATFGPIDPKVDSPTWGYITTTPKPGWANVDVMSNLTDGSVPRRFDTDVNAPAFAEYVYGSDPSHSSVAYITVGTGVGVGLVVNGKTIHGLLHPEGGHIPVKRNAGEKYGGSCPYHKDCVEGFSNSISIAERKGVADRRDLANLPDDDPVWDSVASALGSLCMTLVLIASPEKIVISGGILRRTILMDKIRAKTLELLNGYMKHDLLTPANIDKYITQSKWLDDAGIVGALMLAKAAYEESGVHLPQWLSCRISSAFKRLPGLYLIAGFAAGVGVMLLRKRG